jgi:NAD(P)H-dependent FMN reductase
MLKIGIIVASTRPGRKAAAVAKWAHDILKRRQDADCEIVSSGKDPPLSLRSRLIVKESKKSWAVLSSELLREPGTLAYSAR